MNVERLFLRYAITPAQLLHETTPSTMQVSKTRGEVKIEHEPLKLTIDNRAYHDSIGIKTQATQAQEYAQKGAQAAKSATGKYAQEGDMMLGPNAMSPAEIAASRNSQMVLSELTFISNQKPKLQWSGGDVSIDARPDELNIDWTPYSLDFSYVPYSIDYYMDKW
jgi:hypothetical protein